MSVFENGVGCSFSAFMSNYAGRFIGGEPPENGPYRPYATLIIGGFLLAGHQVVELKSSFKDGVVTHIGILALGRLTASCCDFLQGKKRIPLYGDFRGSNKEAFLPVFFSSLDSFISAYRGYLRTCHTSSASVSKRVHCLAIEPINGVGLILAYALFKYSPINFPTLSQTVSTHIAFYYGLTTATLIDPLFLVWTDKEEDKNFNFAKEVAYKSYIDFTIFLGADRKTIIQQNKLDDLMESLEKEIGITPTTTTNRKERWEKAKKECNKWYLKYHPDKNPDKNPDNAAIFVAKKPKIKKLKDQIGTLYKDLNLDSPSPLSMITKRIAQFFFSS